ncbi:L-rhamnose mutarotase [Steroidobacter flavus]|uniref:L-rhamnose mutarotase n=1 Tax=Steroidobacter flavus TaxID=1842136 RepID=A0ABV8SWZ9_9GAMM
MTTTRRMCFAVDLRDDPEVIASYKRWHAPGGPPAGVTRSLREGGIAVLEIYLIGNRLFMIMDVDARYSPEAKERADATNADVQAWNQLMDTLQQALPFAKPGVNAGKWQPMECIYSLAAQP